MLAWLVIITAFNISVIFLITDPPGAFFQLKGWLFPPSYAIVLMSGIEWLLFLPLIIKVTR
jgi:hypothetical protein